MTSPVQEIVAGLNEVQPTMLGGYPSGLYPLVHEARAGRLRIRPKRIWVGAEPLLPEIRSALEETFGAPVRNGYGSSEVAIRCTGPIDLAALRPRSPRSSSTSGSRPPTWPSSPSSASSARSPAS